MKSKVQTSFVCQECGYDSPSWLGKCPECGNWNSFREIKDQRSLQRPGFGGQAKIINEQIKPQKLNEIVSTEKSRIQTEYGELNTVLGGGIVRGSVILLAGDPGVGKSTLLLQVALSLANTKKVLYVSGEESVEQVKMRADRIAATSYSSSEAKAESRSSVAGAPLSGGPERSGASYKLAPAKFSTSSNNKNTYAENIYLVSLTDTDAIVEQIENLKPDLVIVDSIQAIESQNVSGLSGSIGQVRYGALQFVRSAKQISIPIIIVGHVTKEGMVAGPMILSHMVDCVLFFEGERFTETRVLRSFKNRFGPVDEVGIFFMRENGLAEANNPEQLFITPTTGSASNAAGAGPGPAGSVLVVTLEGSRAFLVEIQALAVRSALPMPRRVVSGMDSRRVELLLAVLQKHLKMPLDRMDVFVNIAGGLRISDPGADLGVCLAVFSSFSNISLNSTVSIAEIGLLGELRVIPGLERRIREAQKLGYKKIITAKTNKTLREVINSFNKSEARNPKFETNPKYK